MPDNSYASVDTAHMKAFDPAFCEGYVAIFDANGVSTIGESYKCAHVSVLPRLAYFCCAFFSFFFIFYFLFFFFIISVILRVAANLLRTGSIPTYPE